MRILPIVALALSFILFAVIAFSAASTGRSSAPETDQHIVCSDKFTGAPLFSFWTSTRRDVTLGIGTESSAVVTLDNGRSVVLTSGDIEVRYDCRVDKEGL